MSTQGVVDYEMESDRQADSVHTLAKQRHGPGVVVVALPMQVVYMNRQAWDFTKMMSGPGEHEQRYGTLPPTLVRICAELQETLQKHRLQIGDPEAEYSRLVGTSEHPILLRAFTLPSQSVGQGPIVLLLLEEVGRRHRTVSALGERFRLTVREKAVVEHLVKGLTNKEIAAMLGIAEPTVKDHIKRIMQKTQSRTRTEILANLLSPFDMLS